MQIITLSIPNWEKYNPRADRNNYSWFRFQNNFFTDPQIFGLSLLEKMLLVFIYSEVSKKGSATCEINVGLAAALLGVSSKDCELALQKLNEINVVSFDNQTPPNGGKEPAFGSPTNERTNERTNDTSETIAEINSDRDGDFFVEQKEILKESKPRKKRDNSEAKEKAERINSFYSRYPRKKDDGDKAAIAKLKRLPLSEFDDLDKALDNYLFHINISKTDPKYYLGLYGFIDARNSWLCRSDLSRMKDALALYKQQAEC